MVAAELIEQGPIAYREATPPRRPDRVPGRLRPRLSRELADVGAAHGGARPRAAGVGSRPTSTASATRPTSAPATFENSSSAFDEWIDSLGLDRVVLVVHDWGGFVGLAWACDHPDRVDALVVSDTGFFADGKWHGMAKALRCEQGEAADRRARSRRLRGAAATRTADDLQRGRHRRLLGAVRARRAASGRRSSSIARWTSRSSRRGRASSPSSAAPTLLLWGADDPFAPLAGAKRFEREIPGAKLVAIEGGGHFVFDERARAGRP